MKAGGVVTGTAAALQEKRGQHGDETHAGV